MMQQIAKEVIERQEMYEMTGYLNLLSLLCTICVVKPNQDS